MLILTVILGFFGLICIFGKGGVISAYRELKNQYDSQQGIIDDKRNGIFPIINLPMLVFLAYYAINVLPVR